MTAGLLRVLEATLTGGVALATALLLAGLVSARPPLVSAGIVVLMLTPLGRVVVLTAALFRSRDYAFGLLSAVVLTVLGSSAWMSLRR
jgi:uncharacterized membrane protein